jgi:hypothetical protein
VINFGLPKTLVRSFSTTNAIENLNGTLGVGKESRVKENSTYRRYAKFNRRRGIPGWSKHSILEVSPRPAYMGPVNRFQCARVRSAEAPQVL